MIDNSFFTYLQRPSTLKVLHMQLSPRCSNASYTILLLRLLLVQKNLLYRSVIYIPYYGMRRMAGEEYSGHVHTGTDR